MQPLGIVTARQLPAPFMNRLSSLGDLRTFDASNPDASLDGAVVWERTTVSTNDPGSYDGV